MVKNCSTCDAFDAWDTCNVNPTTHSENDYCFRWLERGSSLKGDFLDLSSFANTVSVPVSSFFRQEIHTPAQAESALHALDSGIVVGNDRVRSILESMAEQTGSSYIRCGGQATQFLKPHPTWSIFDASKVNEYMMCPRRFFYRYVLGWDSEYRSHDLEFGTAWHLAMEHLLLNGYGKEQIIEAHTKFRNHYEQLFPLENQYELEPKTSGMALLALIAYVDEYNPRDYFKVLYTEVSGSVTVLNGRVMHFRIDTIIEEEDGISSLEHKTTKTLERTFQDKWDLDMQPNLYTHVLYCLFPGKPIKGVTINGTCLHKQGPRTKKPPAEFLRVPVRRKMEMMEDWLMNTDRWLSDIERDYNRLASCNDSQSTMLCFTQNTTSCTDFWGCRFHDFCRSWANPLQYIHDIPTGFIQHYWDPAHPEDHPPAKYVVEDMVIKGVL